MWPFRKKIVDTAPRIWAIQKYAIENWCKVVSPGPLPPKADEHVGPFLSEEAAEQYCDHANAAKCNKVKYYDPSQARSGK